VFICENLWLNLSMPAILIKHGTLVTMDANNSIVTGDLLIENDRIAAIGDTRDSADVVIDASGSAVLPGFIQTHIHLCQTLFRGSADDLSLIDWLKTRIWPMEAAHTPESIAASARLGIAELIKGGTTSALTMETVNHTDEVFKAVEETGFRATVGKCMMDKGDEVPSALHEQTDKSIAESLALLESWHGAANGRIRYCFAPRFAVSCTRELLERVAGLARERGVMVHTHASENTSECAIVEAETGMRNIAYLDSVGVSGNHVALAHCVHLTNEEIGILRATRTNVVHCPSSNMKLGSGIAPLTQLLGQGVSVSLGADGAACNNRLDMFTEMRLAALLQKTLRGPEAVTALNVLQMATIGGAKALGLEREIGSLEVGKKADVILVRLEQLHSTPHVDPVSSLVYSAQASDVETVIIDGQLLMRERKLITIEERETLEQANVERARLFERASLQ
jgi:5-methylthioadenosine/S-adenosylhomocysteine deaminase